MAPKNNVIIAVILCSFVSEFVSALEWDQGRQHGADVVLLSWTISGANEEKSEYTGYTVQFLHFWDDFKHINMSKIWPILKWRSNGSRYLTNRCWISGTACSAASLGKPLRLGWNDRRLRSLDDPIISDSARARCFRSPNERKWGASRKACCKEKVVGVWVGFKQSLVVIVAVQEDVEISQAWVFGQTLFHYDTEANSLLFTTQHSTAQQKIKAKR